MGGDARGVDTRLDMACHKRGQQRTLGIGTPEGRTQGWMGDAIKGDIREGDAREGDTRGVDTKAERGMR